MKNSKIKFVLYAPHQNIWFKNSVRSIIKKELFPNKYGDLLDFLLKSDIDLYITTSMNHPDTSRGRISTIKELLYLILWCLFNRINLRKIRFLFRKKQLLNKDILFFMHYDVFTHESKDRALKGKELAQFFSDVDIFKIVHMTHYLYNIEIGAENIKILKPDMLVAENDLAKNSTFFNKYFSPLTYSFYRLSYIFSKRFEKISSFENRINKVISTGSITYKITDEAFIEYYNVNELQPFRRILYENANLYESEMDCFIYDLDATRNTNTVQKKSFLKRIINRNIFEKILNRFKRKKSSQIEYYKKDIVSLYNSYKMFTVPEEICDLPAIGFVEGMACGSAYIGIDDPMYRDLGLVPDYHYITYDGTIENFMFKVRYFQAHPTELEVIAKNGYDFVRKEFTPENEYNKFLKYLNSKVYSNV